MKYRMVDVCEHNFIKKILVGGGGILPKSKLKILKVPRSA